MAQFAESQSHDQPHRFAEAQDTASAGSAGADAGAEIERIAGNVAATIKEYPIATMAAAAGLAFAIGALWKIGRPRPTHLQALQSRLPELPSARQLRSYWR